MFNIREENEIIVKDSNVLGFIKKSYVDNELSCVEYFNNKKQLHREDGPAKIDYCNNKMISELWYMEGKKLSNEYKSPNDLLGLLN